jgi:hypothetical protein
VNRAAASTPFANDKTAYDYFLGKGLTNFQAAAVVGNLDQESGVNPTISQSGGGVGRGIAQWSTGGRWDTAQGDNVLDYATMQGQSATSLSLQLDFVWYELTTFPDDYGYTKLLATTNVTDATGVFEDNYEGCVYADYPECDLPQRVIYAKDVLAAYGADTVPGGGGAGGGGSSGASAGGSSGASGAAASKGGSSGSGGTNPGASGAASGGSPSAGGSPGVGGSPGAGGSPSAGGSASVAGAATSAAAGTTPSSSSSDTSSNSSCAFASVSVRQSAFGGSFAFAGALLGLGLGLRVSRRRRRQQA